ncbi:MAG: hypothetical protein A2133_07110 [Actinobacteria bacterium RBG_16_64_13]|nr:MAG: hypothetical protein A2133_07110 [Actinobacteria bacterium RBG_16_64_13]
MWGSPGILLQGDGPDGAEVLGSIDFAPANALPRLRTLPFISLPAGSAFIFCLRLEPEQSRHQERRLLHKALAELKARSANEAYALAGSFAESAAPDTVQERGCGLLSSDLLSANGFEQVMDNGGMVLMRADLRGLLSFIGQAKTVVKRVLRNEPTPSPAAWTRRGTS